jgi:hypothetical protein
MYDLENPKKEDKLSQAKKYFKFYIMPLISILIFLSIIIFLVIPKVNEIVEELDKLSQSNSAILDLNNKISDLKDLSSRFDNINSLLTKINIITPSQKTEVVKFRDKITSLANTNNLKILLQRLSEIDSSSTGSTANSTKDILSLIEVPFVFELQGSFDNIKSFIDSLGKIDDFIIVSEMELISNDNNQNNDWIINLHISKYQFNEGNSSKLSEVFLQVDPTAKINKSLEDYLNKR